MHSGCRDLTWTKPTVRFPNGCGEQVWGTSDEMQHVMDFKADCAGLQRKKGKKKVLMSDGRSLRGVFRV